eukprot:gene4946-biopygen1052
MRDDVEAAAEPDGGPQRDADRPPQLARGAPPQRRRRAQELRRVPPPLRGERVDVRAEVPQEPERLDDGAGGPLRLRLRPRGVDGAAAPAEEPRVGVDARRIGAREHRVVDPHHRAPVREGGAGPGSRGVLACNYTCMYVCRAVPGSPGPPEGTRAASRVSAGRNLGCGGVSEERRRAGMAQQSSLSRSEQSGSPGRL